MQNAPNSKCVRMQNSLESASNAFARFDSMYQLQCELKVLSLKCSGCM